MNVKLNEILVDNDFNCRGDDLSLLNVQDLADQIRETGLLHPVILCPLSEEEKKYFPQYNYRLIVGFRRTLAHKLLKAEEIEAKILEGVTAEQQMLMNLSENLQRQDLSPLQEAKTVSRFVSQGMKVDYIARKLGQSTSWVELRLKLLTLPAEVQLMFNAKSIPMSKIRELVNIQDVAGDVRTMQVAARMRDQHLSGHSVSTFTEKKKGDTKRVRTKSEMFELMAKIRQANEGQPNIQVRILAWCAGEITLTDLEKDLTDIYPHFGNV